MADNNRKKAVITGGAGFIGSHIADELAGRGWHVSIIDNLSTGKIENIEHLVAGNRVDFVKGSITDLSLLKNLFSGADYVFHEAAIASVPSSIADPIKANETNITGTLNVLVAARDSGVKKVVFASSSAVYGDSPDLYKNENQPPCPLSPYAVNKLTGEYYCQVFNTVYHLPTACLRYFNVYGPRQNPNSEYSAVIPKFIQMVSEGRAPVIFGDGKQTRDFIYVGDVVAANLLAAESDVTGIMNIGTGENIDLTQLTDTILSLMDRNDLRPVYQNERPGDIKHSLADIRRSRANGFSPRYTLNEGLKQLLSKVTDKEVTYT
jgi:UDP-glucose 4-epimerase